MIKSSINESSKLVIVSSSSVSTPGILSGQDFCIACLTPLWKVCPTFLMAFFINDTIVPQDLGFFYVYLTHYWNGVV